MKREMNGKEKEGSNRASFSSKFDTRCAGVSVRFYIEISLGTLLDWTIWHESEKAFAYVSNNVPSAEFQLIVATRL